MAQPKQARAKKARAAKTPSPHRTGAGGADVSKAVRGGIAQPVTPSPEMDRKSKSPFAPWVWVPQRLLPAATARWMQWGKTARGALGRDGTRGEVCNHRHGAHGASEPHVSSWL